MPGHIVIGLISDTHGLLRPEAFERLKGSDFIVHAGDVGNPGILAELGRLAPVTAVRGNTDRSAWAACLPETEVLEAGGAFIYVIHDIKDIALVPATGFQAVVSGHSHKPDIRWKDGVLYVNPGSAGPRRFALPVSVARLHVERGKVSALIQEITPIR